MPRGSALLQRMVERALVYMIFIQFKTIGVVEATWYALVGMKDGKMELLANMAYWIWHVRCDTMYEGNRWMCEVVVQWAYNLLLISDVCSNVSG